jgi:hypothetical protein
MDEAALYEGILRVRERLDLLADEIRTEIESGRGLNANTLRPEIATLIREAERLHALLDHETH